jgi:hypothetical protein
MKTIITKPVEKTNCLLFNEIKEKKTIENRFKLVFFIKI